jgi:hypothetical protein
MIEMNGDIKLGIGRFREMDWAVWNVGLID